LCPSRLRRRAAGEPFGPNPRGRGRGPGVGSGGFPGNPRESTRPLSPQAQRQPLDRAQVLGDIVAHRTIPSGEPEREPAIDVAQGHRHTVDLQLHDVGDRLLAAEKTPHPSVELEEFIPRVRVAQAQHRRRMGPGDESLDGRSADPSRRAGGVVELGMLLLEAGQLLQQTVVGPVADLGGGENVVQMVVALDLPP